MLLESWYMMLRQVCVHSRSTCAILLKLMFHHYVMYYCRSGETMAYFHFDRPDWIILDNSEPIWMPCPRVNHVGDTISRIFQPFFYRGHRDVLQHPTVCASDHSKPRLRIGTISFWRNLFSYIQVPIAFGADGGYHFQIYPPWYHSFWANHYTEYY